MHLSGRVNNILFEDAAKAFYIARMALDQMPAGLTPMALRDGLVTVTGHVPGVPVRVGTWFAFDANWVEHPKHGRQLQITRAPVLRGGWTPDVAIKMLASNGVSVNLLKAILAHVGEDRFLPVIGDITLLEAVPGVPQFSALHLVSRWTSVRAHFQTVAFLADVGVPSGLVRQVWTQFGDAAEKVLSEDPWSLVQVDGIAFSQADEVANKLGLDLADVRRLRGAILWACRSQRGLGHVFLQSGDLLGAVGDLLGPDLDRPTFAKALYDLHNEGILCIDKDTRPGVVAIYEAPVHDMEVAVAVALEMRARRAGNQDVPAYVKALAGVGPATALVAETGDLKDTVTAAIDEWGRQSSIQLTPDQKTGVFNALCQPVSILTGLPGTGKSTSCRAIVSILKDAGIQPLLLAPTGIAAKNLSMLTGSPAQTIHRAFMAKGSQDDDGRASTYVGIVGDGPRSGGTMDDGAWGFSAAKTHPARVVLVDETSMVDLHLLYRLLVCTDPDCRLVFIGDADQLPSVGPGNVLRDLIQSNRFPVVSLLDIFRQQDASDIVVAAHDMHAGRVPACDPPSEFILLEVPDENAAQEKIIQLAASLYKRRDNFQILSPRHAGAVGVTALNDKLRDLLNPRQPGLLEVKMGQDAVREGDRVMVVKNNYNLGVFNGDVGKIARIDRAAKEIEVKIHGDVPAYIRFPMTDAPKHLRLAYACTIHKMQGLAADVIVMPILTSFRQQLQRNLLYTAITRARKQVILVGSKVAMALAVANDRQDRRNTLLADRLMGPIQAKTVPDDVPAPAAA